MKVAVFSTNKYDEEFLNRFNTGHELSYFPVALTEDIGRLSSGFESVCLFVNDQVMADFKFVNFRSFKILEPVLC